MYNSIVALFFVITGVMGWLATIDKKPMVHVVGVKGIRELQWSLWPERNEVRGRK